MLLVLVGMVVLPLLYVGMVTAVGWGLKWYLVHGLEWALQFTRRAERLALFLYLAVILAGLMLIVFLLKPLVLTRRKPAPSLEINAASEPLLFEFIHRICDLVGARHPSKVIVNCEVNAAAGLQGLLSGKLELTLGLPLVAGLTARQFSGVLAHEFGHFTQGTGMRLSFMIRRLNRRFLRMVHEQDSLDMWIEHWQNSGVPVMAAAAGLGQALVRLGRAIMGGFIWAAGAFSGFMSRQMEYDADACMAGLAGSREGGAILRRLRALDIASAPAIEQLVGFAENGRLPDNLPDLIAEWEAMMPVELRRKIDALSNNDESSWTCTHPADCDRIEAMLALEQPGVFTADLPASALFADFDAVCRAATLHFYEVDQGHHLRSLPVFSLKEEQRLQKQDTARQAAYREIFGGHVNAMRHAVMPMATPQHWQAAHAVTAQHRLLYHSMVEEWLKTWDLVLDKNGGMALSGSGFAADKLGEFFTHTHSFEAVQDEHASCLRDFQRLSESLHSYEVHAWTRVSAALAWRYSMDPAVTESWRREVSALVAAQRALVPAVQHIAAHSSAAYSAWLLNRNASLHADANPCRAQAAGLERQVIGVRDRVLTMLAAAADPYCPHGRPLATTLWQADPYGDNKESLSDFNPLTKSVFLALEKVSGDLCRLAVEVEVQQCWIQP